MPLLASFPNFIKEIIDYRELLIRLDSNSLARERHHIKHQATPALPFIAHPSKADHHVE